MILDTSFFLDLIAGRDAAMSRAKSLESESVPQRVPAQVVYELYVGVGYTDSPASEEERLAGVLAGLPVVDTTEDIARRAGRLDGQLRRDGDRVPTSDIIIGATGLAYDEPVLTGDVEHFERLPGLSVMSY